MTFRTLIADEQGNLSSARCLLWLTTTVALRVIYLDATEWADPSAAAYALLTTMILAFTAWAGGPRLAQYLLPQLGAAVQAVSSALRERLRPGKRPAREASDAARPGDR